MESEIIVGFSFICMVDWVKNYLSVVDKDVEDWIEVLGIRIGWSFGVIFVICLVIYFVVMYF